MANGAGTSENENDDTPGHNEEAAQFPGAAHLADWLAWAAPIEQSPVLTPEGRVAAHRAVASIRRALGEDFLQRALAIPSGHPIFSPGHWPANQVIWVYVNLFQLATQFELLRRPGSQLWKVTRSLQTTSTQRTGRMDSCNLKLPALACNRSLLFTGRGRRSFDTTGGEWL